MSHKTGKRVLTASTSLALAVVGLAVAPISAHAAAMTKTISEGCGTADTLTFTQPTGADATASTLIKGYSVNGGTTQSLPAADASGNIVIPLTSYDATTGNGVKVDLIAQDNTIVVGAAAASYTNVVCTLSPGAGPDAVPALAVTAPSISADAPGATLTLHYQAGYNWTVTVDGTTTTYAAADFPIVAPATTPVDDVAKTITVTGAQIVATAVPLDSNHKTMPSPLSWDFSADGIANASTPTAPTVDGVGAVTTPAGTGFTWKSSPTYVTDPAAATSPADVTLDPGQTLRYWAVADSGYKFNDGTSSKYFDVTYTMNTIMKPAAPTWNDRTGTANDTFMVPDTAGVHYFYTFDTDSTPPAFMATAGVPDATANTTAGWLALTEGSEVTVPTTTKPYVHVVAVLDDAKTSRFNTGTTAAPVYSVDPQTYTSAQYTANVVVTPAAPSYVDASGADSDSYTFPAATTGVTYTVTAAGHPVAGADATAIAATMAANAGKTFTRAQWQSVFPALTATELTGPVRFLTRPAAATGYTLSPTATDVAPWDVTLYSGQSVALPSPQFIDNSGTTTADQVKVTKVANVKQQIKIGAAALRDITDAEYASGISVTAGEVVQVVATADPGYTLVTSAVKADGTTVLSNDNTVATFDYDFNATAYVTAADPIATNKSGTDADTYTIVGASGVDYYVNGVKFDPAKFNLPQSTGGAQTITVTAVPQAPNTWSDGTTAEKSWTLDFTDQGPTNLVVDHSNVSDAPPTAKVTWSADNATSYTVTYQKKLSNGERGPEMPWLTDTTETSANFVAMAGDQYYIRVVAMDDAGNTSDVSETLVVFGTPPGLIDITTGIGTFNNAWSQLTNLKATQNLPYYGDTAALGYTNAEWTVTVPAGTTKFDLFATVHSLGAAGKIQVNGQNWADFTTNSSYWSTVSDPYSYPVRTIQGWDSSKPATIKVIATDAGVKYLALDAYKPY